MGQQQLQDHLAYGIDLLRPGSHNQIGLYGVKAAGNESFSAARLDFHRAEATSAVRLQLLVVAKHTCVQVQSSMPHHMCMCMFAAAESGCMHASSRQPPHLMDCVKPNVWA